jgi:hypothetical protein
MDRRLRFWEDKWPRNATLREQYLTMYNIVCFKGNTITTVMGSSPPNMLFKRDLIGHRIKAWYALLERLAAVQLLTRTDEFRWNLHVNESF